MPNIREIIDLYQKEWLSIEDVAKKVGSSYGVVHRILKGRGLIRTKPVAAQIGWDRRGRALSHREKVMVEALHKKKKSTRQISRETGVNHNVVYKYLNDRGLIRGIQEAQRLRAEEDYKGQKKGRIMEAVALVYDEGLTQREAAERMGVARSTLQRYLKIYKEGKIWDR